MRHTSSHSKNRRSHHALTAAAAVKDKESGALRLPHRLDETTGMYRGKQILPKKVIKQQEEREEEKAKAKREGSHEHTIGPREQIHSEKEEMKSTGVLGRLTKGKAKARSGMGGGA